MINKMLRSCGAEGQPKRTFPLIQIFIFRMNISILNILPNLSLFSILNKDSDIL